MITLLTMWSLARTGAPRAGHPRAPRSCWWPWSPRPPSATPSTSTATPSAWSPSTSPAPASCVVAALRFYLGPGGVSVRRCAPAPPPAGRRAGSCSPDHLIAMPTAAPVEIKEPDVDEVTDLDRPWKVIVWNDPINLMSYVTFVFQKLFGYSQEKAHQLMLDVHFKGKAVVSHGPEGEGGARRVPPPRARLVGDHGARQLSPLLPRRLVRRDRQRRLRPATSTRRRPGDAAPAGPAVQRPARRPRPAGPAPAVPAGVLRGRPTSSSRRSTAG